MSRRRPRMFRLRGRTRTRLIILAILTAVAVMAGSWVWDAWNRALHPGVTDVDTAMVFLAGAVVTLVVGEVLAAGRREVKKDADQSGTLATTVGMLVVPLPALALWAAVGWLPWTAHYGIPALVSLVLIPVVGWSMASQVASYSRASASLGEVWEPVRRHSIVPILGALTGTGVWTALTLTWGTPGIPALIGWTSLTAATASGILAGVVIAREYRGDENLAGQVAAVLGVPDAKLAEMRWWIDRRQRIHIKGPLPASAINNLPDLDERIVSRMPTHEVGEASPALVVFVPVTKATSAARELVGDTDGYVLAETEIPDAPAHQPCARLWELTGKARVTTGPAVDVQARKRGLTVVEYSPEAHTAIVAALDPETRLIRDRVADALKVRPWDVELTVTQGDGHIEAVEVLRAPVIQPTKRRLETWQEIITSVIPDGSAGWEIEDRPVLGEMTLTWGQQPELPASVPLDALLPETITAGDWDRLPLGIGADGTPVGIDLTAGPHALIAGPTGSGKTVALLTSVAGALARGHRLVLIDPTKAGLDFASLQPWATAWADELPAARRAMELVYEEVARRKAVLKRHGEVKWSDLPDDVRDDEDIAPLTVLIDEYGSLALETTIPKSLPKEDPLVISATETNAHRAVIKELVGRVAREARFVGIHLQIALQRPDVSIMGSGELRSNLTSAVQLAPPGRGVAGDALRMLFSADVVDAASEQIALLDDGESRGLAVIAAEGGTARGLRVGFTPMREIPALLNELGVPRVRKPWDLTVEEVDDIDCGPEPVGGRQRAREQQHAGKVGGGGDALAALREMQRLDAERAAAATGGGEDWASVEPPDSIEPDEPWLTPVPVWDHTDD